MAVRFSDDQVIKATGGRRLQAGARPSYDGVCTDTRALTPGCLFVALQGERFDAHAFIADAIKAGAAGAVVRRGFVTPSNSSAWSGVSLFEVDDTLRALGGLARFHRLRFHIPLGAVTGSNGKTTTKEMLAAILETRGPALSTRGNLNNEVGVPLTLFGLSPSHVAAVVEMGLNHVGELTHLTEMAQPTAGLITVIQPAHLLGLGSIDGVANAKGELFRGLNSDATAVVNADDARVVAQAENVAGRKLTYGRSPQAQVRLLKAEVLGAQGLSLEVGHGKEVARFRLNFLGEHNALNATGAFALALAMGYSVDECVRGLEKARPYARRLNWVEVPSRGIRVLDDCYNANPSSMSAALKTLKSVVPPDGRAVAVLGDMLELGENEKEEHRRLGEFAAEVASVVAFFGPLSEQGFRAAERAGITAAHFVEIDPMLLWLHSQVRRGDVVLVKASRSMKLERAVEALTGEKGGSH